MGWISSTAGAPPLPSRGSPGDAGWCLLLPLRGTCESHTTSSCSPGSTNWYEKPLLGHLFKNVLAKAHQEETGEDTNKIRNEKRNELSNHGKTQKDMKCVLLSEKNQSENATNYMIPNTTFGNRQNCGDSKEIRGCQGLRGREGWIAAQSFLCQWNYSVWCYNDGCTSFMHLYTERTPRVNPNVNYGHWVTETNQCRFLDWNKCTSLMQDVDGGGNVCTWAKGIWEIHLLLNFAMSLKLP